MKLYKPIIVILLLLFSVALVVVGDTSSRSTISVDEYSSLTTGNDLPTVNDYQAYNPMIEFVIFAENNDEFSIIKKMETLKVYDNLQAIVVKQSLSDFDLFYSAMPGKVIRMSAFDKIRFEPIIESSGIILDNSVSEQSLIDINRMWDFGYNGIGVNVTVFDNGVSTSHPGLEGQVVQSVDFNVVDGKTYGICQSHGTLVAGTIAATGQETSGGPIDDSLRGAAFGSSIISVNIGCTSDGEGIIGDWLGAFDWIIANNATIDVVNMSWGGGYNNFDVIITKLAKANIISVSSAGNEGPDYFTISGGPGQAADTITVGASNGGSAMASFSSRGPIPGLYYKPEVLAPGVDIMTTDLDGTYTAVSGTSFSSPMTAGAVATIISALRAHSIPYNPGLIKAVLMNNATDQGFDEPTQGSGRIQTFKSWLNILNADRAEDGIPMAVDMLPRTGTLPYSSMRTIFRERSSVIPFTLVSSHPGKTTVEISGNIAEIMSFNDSQSIDPDLDSQYLYLNIDTHDKLDGTYSGYLTVTLGDAIVTAYYSITVSGIAKATVLMDHRHTWWDSTGSDVIGGSNTGIMIEIAQSKGIWIDEYAGVITSAKLANYDILWMPDPFGRSYTANDELVAEVMLPSEITAITNFVNAGGSLFVDFNGKMYDPEVPEYPYVGTNATEANRLLSNFDILASETVMDTPNIPYTVRTNNFTSPVGEARHITHFGNFLTVSNNAKSIVGSGASTTTAINDLPNSAGRVLVSSTNFWLDNIGATGGYSAKENDVIFSNNVWDWFTADTQVKFISSSIVGTNVTGQFKVLENGIPTSTTPVVKRLGNSLLASLEITPIDIGGDVWEFTFDATDQGIHRFQIAYDNDYAAWEITVDTIAPSITNVGNIVNGSTVSKQDSIFLSFKVKDNISPLGRADIEVLIDGNELSSEGMAGYNVDTFKLIVILYPSELTGEEDHVFVLTISVADEKGNQANYSFHFSLGDVAPETTSTPDDTTTSSDITTPTTSTSDETETPYSIVFTLLSFFSIALIATRRKNK